MGGGNIFRCQHFWGVKKILESKFVWSQNLFGVKNFRESTFLGHNIFGGHKISEAKILVVKILGRGKKNLGGQHFWGSTFLGGQQFWGNTNLVG